MTRPVHIHIRTRELAGFMAAAFLTSRYPAWRITLEDRREAGRVDCGELYAIAPPDLRKFHRGLRLGEGHFIKATRAAIYLGDEITIGDRPPFRLTFGDTGSTVEGQGYYDVLRAQDRLHQVGAHNFPARLMAEGRFLPPDAKGRPVLSDYDYGYQFDVQAYAELMLQLALSRGLELASPETADLHIEAAGASAGAYGCDWMPFGFSGLSKIERTCRHARDPMPLGARLRYDNGLKTVEVQDQIEGLSLSFSRNGQTGCGHNAKAWVGDTVKIGLSQARMEPVLGSPLRAVLLDLERLASLMPGQFDTPVEAQEYNRLTDEMYRRIRDFQSLPHAVAGGVETSAEVREKLELFAATGRMVTLDQDKLFQDQWHPLLLGLGVLPRRSSAMARAISADAADAVLAPRADLIENVLPTVPYHAAFIARSCAAPGFQYEAVA